MYNTAGNLDFYHYTFGKKAGNFDDDMLIWKHKKDVKIAYMTVYDREGSLLFSLNIIQGRILLSNNIFRMGAVII